MYLAKRIGLKYKHSYSILEAREVIDKEGYEVQLVRLRNPWGKTSFTGDWGPASEMWTDELKEQLNYSGEDNGQFWIAFKDMKDYFVCVEYCKVHDDYAFSFLKVEQPVDAFSMIRFSVPKTGKYTMSVT